MSKFVLVETISQFRMRYVVELKDSNPIAWALDTVSCEEATEFSQEHLGETIVSHRQISEQEMLELFYRDNDYLDRLTPDEIKEKFVTKIKDWLWQRVVQKMVMMKNLTQLT